MSWLKPEKAKAPPARAVAAKPTQLDEDVLQKQRDRRRAQLLKAGRAGTILTEGQTLGASSLLGRNA